MNDQEQRRPVADDDSLLASVAGVPLTRSARIGACLIWAGFWCARILLTDALLYINAGQARPALLELLGESAFDQAFSIGMAWLTVEVAIIVWNYIKRRLIMLIAKTTKPFLEQLLEALSDDKLEAVATRSNQLLQDRKEARAKRNSKRNGKGGNGGE